MDLPQWLLRYSEIRGRLIQFAEHEPGERAHHRRSAQQPRERHQGAPQDARRAARRQRCWRARPPNRRRSQKSVAKDAKLKKNTGDPWSDIDVALAAERGIFQPYTYHRKRRRFPGPARGLRAHAGARRRRARQAERPALPRIHRQRAAAHRAAARRRRARVPGARGAAPRQQPRAHARMAGPGPSRGAQAAVEGIAGGARQAPGDRDASSPTRPCAWSCGKAGRPPSPRRTIR